MPKSNKSKHHICIAAIKRSTIKPYDFKWTKFYESNADFHYAGILPDWQENELVICSTFVDAYNYSILTTQRLLTKENSKEYIGNMQEAIYKDYGDFKGIKNNPFTFGAIILADGTELKYFIETGRASMIMINGVSTLIGL